MTIINYQINIVDMTYTYSKSEYVTALRTTFIGDTKSLKEVSDYFATTGKRPGFLIAMMEIVDDATLEVEVKQAALIQLKNNLKLRWNAEKEQIVKQEKELIKNTLLLAVIRCNNNYKLIKLYKEIFTIIVTHDYKTWMPVPEILQKIRQNQDLVPLIHCLIAIATSFEFSISEDQRLYFCEFLKNVLPVLLELVTRNQQPQIVYLCIKFLWKAIHYEINNDTKLLACGWMPLILAIINATNPTHDANPEQIQPRQTEQFYYFHSKKWATRIFLRFIQRHAKRVSYNKKEDNRPFSDQWYNNYGLPMITALVNQFKVRATNKVRFFQLKCLHTLINQKPDVMKQYGEAFQYDILLNYIKLQPDDEELAQKDPIQFLSKEGEPSFSFNNIKRVATDAWIGFAEIGSKINKKSKLNEFGQAGKAFYHSMNYLQTKLQQNNNPIEKELAMYLICQLRSPITRCKEVKDMLPSLIAKYVIPEFKNQIMFLRARAVDIFTEYGSMELDQGMIKQAVEGVYICLTKDTYPLVRIKAATAFNCILKHKSAKDLVKPLLSDILTVYLQLLEHYDLQNIVMSLESIVEHFSQEIGPFALELIRHLARLYYKLFHKDIARAEEDEYDGEAELAAAGCLKTITRIIESSMPEEALSLLEAEIISLLEFIFLADGNDYIEDGLVLLNSYLFKIKKITSGLTFYYQAIVYIMVGIPKEMWSTIDTLPLSETQKAIMKMIKDGSSIEYIEQSTLVLRNYLQICAQSHDAIQQAIKNNMVNLLFYLCSEVYKKQHEAFEGEVNITCCTALLVNLLENHQTHLPEHTYTNIWEIAKINLQKTKSKILKTLNSQLLALLIWVAPTQVLTLAHRDNLLDTLLKQVVGYECKYAEEYERARTILGLNTLLALPEKPQQIMTMIPDIFKTNLKLVKKNAQSRINAQNEEYNSESDESDDNDFDNYSFHSDDDEYWEQNYDDNYSSALDQVDEIAEFKKTIEKLAIEQPAFYNELVKTVPNTDLIEIQAKIKAALTKIQNLAQS